MSVDTLLTALVGAFFGSSGWLLVGMWLQRRQADRQARNAARAVYFELAMNQIDISVAAEHLVFQPLRRASFDRLLPEMATWCTPEHLETVVRAYMSLAGYEQAQRDESLPDGVRRAVLQTVLQQHRAASDLLRRTAFSSREAARLTSMSSTSTTSASAGARNA
jgi:hypothetical protein